MSVWWVDMPPQRTDPVIRFWPKVNKTNTCWLWTGGDNGLGYGKFWSGERMVYAHRFAWELLRGPIPDGDVLDHDNPQYGCSNRSCVNPDHLEVVPQRRNIERAAPGTLNKTGVRGVSWSTASNKWLVRVVRSGRIFHGGFFADLEDAKRAAVSLRARVDAHLYGNDQVVG
jgi:hypothetical protein